MSSDIQIGAVEIKNGASDVRALVVVATSDSAPNLDATNLLGVHSLLSARKDATTTVGLTAEDSTHNALHVAITDGEGVASVNASNALEVALTADDYLELWTYHDCAAAKTLQDGSASTFMAVHLLSV